MMVMMTQISSALSSLREKIMDTGQPAKHCFTSNLCFLCHFRNTFESFVDRVATALSFSILSLPLSFLFFILKSILRILEILRDENLCVWKSDNFFFRDRSKKFRKLLQIEKKTINFLRLKSDDLFLRGDKTFMLQIGKCAGASSGMQI